MLLALGNNQELLTSSATLHLDFLCIIRVESPQGEGGPHHRQVIQAWLAKVHVEAGVDSKIDGLRGKRRGNAGEVQVEYEIC